MLPVVIIGGLKIGAFTPTEAAVIAAAYCLFAGMVIDREIRFRDLFRLIYRASETTAVVMFLVTAAGVSAWLITTANIPEQVTVLVQPFRGSPMLMTCVTPFTIAQTIVMFLLVVFPQIVLWPLHWMTR